MGHSFCGLLGLSFIVSFIDSVIDNVINLDDNGFAVMKPFYWEKIPFMILNGVYYFDGFIVMLHICGFVRHQLLFSTHNFDPA